MTAATVANLIAGFAGLHRIGPAALWLAAALAIPLAWIVHWIGGFPLLLVGTLIGAATVAWAAPRAAAPMISDRFVGQWLALWPLSAGLWHAGVAPRVFPWPGWVGGFVVFNLLLLVPAIRRLGARHPLADDLVAGIVAALLVLVSAGVAHGGLR